MIRAILSWYTGVCAALVLIVQGLSVFRAIGPGPLAAIAGAVAVVAMIVFVLRRQRSAPRGALRWRRSAPPVDPLVFPFALAVPVIATLAFALAWHTPPNNSDAMTYHLARAAYWRQAHTLAHYPTNDARQDAFPGNREQDVFRPRRWPNLGLRRTEGRPHLGDDAARQPDAVCGGLHRSRGAGIARSPDISPRM